jgi:hypothetical protein
MRPLSGGASSALQKIRVLVKVSGFTSVQSLPVGNRYDLCSCGGIIMGTEQAAALIGCGPHMLWKLVREGMASPIVVGRSTYMWTTEAIDQAKLALANRKRKRTGETAA